MAALLFLMLFLTFTGHSSGSATWCVCKGAGDGMLQKTLDYACGAGADCTPIHDKGPCFNPNTVRSHCNYAVNSFFQRKGQAPGTCDFAGSAMISVSDPSTPGCTYLATASTGATGITTTPGMTNPGITTTTPNTGTTTNPYLTNPTNGGVLGGITGVGPSGAGINNDMSHGGYRIQASYFFITLLFSGLML